MLPSSGPRKYDEGAKLNVACVTWGKNETGFLRFWFRYYASLFGESHCYIIDHNSKEQRPEDVLGPTQANIVRIPMEKARDHKAGDPYEFDRVRFRFLSQFSRSLLNYYDVVIYNDTDEIYFPDPGKYENLKAYLQAPHTQRCRAGVGVEPFHDFEAGEADFDFSGSLFAQRPNFIYRMHHSKPMILRKGLALGGHGVNEPFELDANLYLLHLKYVDKKSMEERQDFLHGLYQNKTVTGQTRWRFDREQIVEQLKGYAALPEGGGPCHVAEFEKLLSPTEFPEVFLVNTRPAYYPYFELTKSLPNGSMRDLGQRRFRFDSSFAQSGV